MARPFREFTRFSDECKLSAQQPSTLRQSQLTYFVNYCHPDLPTFNELLEDCDDRLFHKLCSNTGHSLHYLLPPSTTASQHYNLHCTSTHNRQLPARTGHLTDGNYFIRHLLHKNCYLTFISVFIYLSLFTKNGTIRKQNENLN